VIYPLDLFLIVIEGDISESRLLFGEKMLPLGDNNRLLEGNESG
jgi:hypothetical protein